MKAKLSKKEAQERIKEFFENTKKLDPKNIKKIKRLAMKYNIKLGNHRKRFCKKCFGDLKEGRVRVTKMYKNVECGKCGFKNRWKIR